MFTRKVLIQQSLLHRFSCGEKPQCFAGHLYQMFEHYRIVDGFADRPAPGKGAVAGNEGAYAAR